MVIVPFQTQPGTVIDDVSDSADYASPSGTLTNDTANTFNGVNAVRNVTNAGANNLVSKTISSVDISNATTICLALYIDTQEDKSDLAGSTYKVTLDLGTGGATNSWTLTDTDNHAAQGWTLCTLSVAAKAENGTPTPDNITYIRYRLQSTDGGKPFSCTLGGVWADARQRPKVCLTFDDGHTSQYDEAFSYMRPRGVPGTIFINSSTVDGGTTVSTAELTEMANSGWDVCNHSSVHTAMTVLSTADWRTNMEAGKDYNATNGFNNTIMAPPGGQYNDSGMAVVEDLGYQYARSVSGQTVNLSYGISRKWNLPGRILDDTDTTQDGIDFVDKCLLEGCGAVFYFHALEASPGSGNWYINRFQPLIDDIVTKRDNGSLDIITMSEMVALNPRLLF